VKAIAKASETGHATNIIAGLAVGMEATALPVVVIGGAIFDELLDLRRRGIWRLVRRGGCGGVDVVDGRYRGGDRLRSVRSRTTQAGSRRWPTWAKRSGHHRSLDAVGNTTKAVTKGLRDRIAGLAAVVLFAEYAREVAKGSGASTFDLSNPSVLVGLFLGGCCPSSSGPLYEGGGGGGRSRGGKRCAGSSGRSKGLWRGRASRNTGLAWTS